MENRRPNYDRVIAYLMAFPLVASLWIWFIARVLKTMHTEGGFGAGFWLSLLALLAATLFIDRLLTYEDAQETPRG